MNSRSPQRSRLTPTYSQEFLFVQDRSLGSPGNCRRITQSTSFEVQPRLLSRTFSGLVIVPSSGILSLTLDTRELLCSRRLTALAFTQLPAVVAQGRASVTREGWGFTPSIGSGARTLNNGNGNTKKNSKWPQPLFYRYRLYNPFPDIRVYTCNVVASQQEYSALCTATQSTAAFSPVKNNTFCPGND